MKYIIDIPKEYESDWVNKSSRLGFELCFPINETATNKKYHIPTGLKLESYTEPDRKAIENEVWEFVCKFVWAVDDKKILGTDILHAVRDMTYQEAKAKYKTWIKQMDEIRVGDEVKHRGLNYVVGYVGADKVYHLIDKNWLRTVVQGGYQLIKTGRHFPEVAELLKKMRDTE